MISWSNELLEAQLNGTICLTEHEVAEIQQIKKAFVAAMTLLQASG